MSSPNKPRARRTFRTGEDKVDDAISALVELLPEPVGERRREYARQVITATMKCCMEGGSAGDMKLLAAAIKELRWAFKVFGPARDTRKVTVFGSARTKPGEPAYEQAKDFGARMAKLGWGVITGAGEGIMGAAHGGAGRASSYGANIELPFEAHANETVRGDPKLVNFKYFFTRKLVFLKETDGIVLFPGGFGTHDEGFETLTLIQTGKADPLPVVFVEPKDSDYWEEWNDYVVRHLEEPGLISPRDRSLYLVTDDVDVALQEVQNFYRVYHSQRFVGENLVMRLQAELSENRLAELNDEFDYMLKDGAIVQCGALDEEREQPEIAQLPRLVLHYNRANAAGLRALIDRVNQTAPEDLGAVAHVGPDPNEERADRGGMPEPDEPEDDAEDA